MIHEQVHGDAIRRPRYHRLPNEKSQAPTDEVEDGSYDQSDEEVQAGTEHGCRNSACERSSAQ